MTFVECTTWSRRRRHLADEAMLEPYRYGGGRTGPGLCWQSGGVLDQEGTDAEAAHFKLDGRWAPGRIVVADLPPCKRCEQRHLKVGAP